MNINDKSVVSLPIRNLLFLCGAVAAGILAYTEITSRLTSLETSRELHQADLLKKSEQLPTDQEQFMLLEHIAGQVENVQKEMETMRNNNVNITYAMKDIEKIKKNLEAVKDKVRANGIH
jgi:predicted  nucleic acid-binding Zn-ribbon protein|tara:strand:- start:4820 stop:5179 length:360 start_codon:yes stop_codon:yes gene_type:complete